MEDKKYGNKLIVAKGDIENYVYSIIQMLQPRNYEESQSIKIQVIESNLPQAEFIVSLFKNLWLEETSREKTTKEITPEGKPSYKLEVIEITLEKHPRLRR